MRRYTMGAALAFAVALGAAPAAAETLADPAGDIYPHFATNPGLGGGPVPGGFDVLSFGVGQNATDFLISATFAGAPDQIGDGIHVFGVDRGGAGAPFGADQPGVLFNSVVVYDPATPGGAALFVVLFGVPGPPLQLGTGSLVVDGNNLTFRVPLSALPSTSFAFQQYGWNLWPRFPAQVFTNVADFAPDNATLTSIPEPATWAMMIGGFGLVGGALRRRSLPKPRSA